MKIIQLFIVFMIGVLSVNAQQLQGTWHAQLNLAMPLKLVLHIEKDGKKWSTKMDSPDQNAFGIALENTTVKGQTITIQDSRMQMQINTQLQGDSLVGQFKQGGLELPIVLYNNEARLPKKKINRPQTPKAPFDYNIDTLNIKDANGLNIHGVFTYPKGKTNFPVVVLISGSGTQDMDVTIFEHKLFWVIADYLTQNGIGVFRFDDKGAGKSEGNPMLTTTDVIVEDVYFITNALQQKYSNQINAMHILGHSQGGTVAMKYAAQQPKNLNSIILMAAPGILGKDLILQQYQTIGKMNGLSEEDINKIMFRNGQFYDAVITGKDSIGIASALEVSVGKIYPTLSETEKSGMSQDAYFQTINQQMNNAIIKDLVAYTPADDLSKIKCKVLAINGDLDIQVLSTPNLAAITKGLAGSEKEINIKSYPYLNHLFQYAITGAIEEYETIDETIEVEVLEDLASYLNN